MALSYWLCSLKMCVSGHDVVNLLFNTGCDDVEQADQVLLHLSEVVAEPHAHVADNRLIAAAAGVKLVCNDVANDLAQPALLGCEDVLVNAGNDGQMCQPPIPFTQALLKLLKLLQVMMPVFACVRLPACRATLSK